MFSSLERDANHSEILAEPVQPTVAEPVRQFCSPNCRAGLGLLTPSSCPRSFPVPCAAEDMPASTEILSRSFQLPRHRELLCQSGGENLGWLSRCVQAGGGHQILLVENALGVSVHHLAASVEPYMDRAILTWKSRNSCEYPLTLAKKKVPARLTASIEGQVCKPG